MKYNIMLLFLIITPFQEVHTQIEWELQNPIPTNSELTSVQFVNADTGWAIGSWGGMIKTTDGGDSWNNQSVNVDEISDIFFVDSENGWAIGMTFTGKYVWGIPIRKSSLLKIEDGGNSWTLQSGFSQEYDSGPFPYSIHFVDRNTGWIASNLQNSQNYNTLISKTTDGGENWVVQDSVKLDIRDLFFLDEQIGWAVGGWSSAFKVTILKTIDGGENWIPQLGGVNGVLESVFFINENIGWTVGTENMILKTTDGGDNWVNLTSAGSTQYLSVCFTDSNNGYVTGWFKSLRTTDGGITWQEDKVGNQTFLSVCFVNPQVGWRVGTQGIIQKTIDAGADWFNQSKSFTYNDLAHVDFVNEKYGWVTDREGQLYSTKDGGKSWRTKIEPSNKGSYDFDFIDSLIGYSHYESGIYKTVDGGSNWVKVYSFSPNPYPSLSIFFMNASQGWIVFDRGRIIHTSDGGLSWNEQKSNTDQPLFDIEFVDDKHGWIVGEKGVILRTNNSGENWENIEIFDAEFDIVKVDFTNPLNGWIVGKWFSDLFGPVLHTTDGGDSWNVIEFEENFHGGNDIEFLDENIGWMLGYYNTTYYSGAVYLYQTIDGGNNWEKRVLPGQLCCGPDYQIDFISGNEGWLIGNSGTVLHITSNPSTSIKDVFQQKRVIQYSMSQNYPNPFNPNTKINYAITEQNHITLKVFDVLGREVAILVNNEQPQGNYEVEFDASSLTSGIYFYRIQAGDYVETKKMVLMK